MTSAPPRQQVQTGGEGGRLLWVSGGTGSQEKGPPSLDSSGPARSVGETCWVSSHVFPHKAESCGPGWKVERGEGALF